MGKIFTEQTSDKFIQNAQGTHNKTTIFKGTKDLNREKFYKIETGWDLKSLVAVLVPDKCLLDQQNAKKLPWTARRTSQSILKEINPEYSLEGLMLKLQFFGCLIQKVPDVKDGL